MSKASSRLQQIAAQIQNPSPNPSSKNHTTSSAPKDNKRKSRARKNKNTLPSDWSDVLDQADTIRNIARSPPISSPGYVRQKRAGKLWVRERIDALLDPGSFQEVGSVAGTVTWRTAAEDAASGKVKKDEVQGFTPSNNVQGFGTVGGRQVLFTADDFSLRAGHADGAIWAKTVYMERLCLDLRLPVVKLVDGSSGGGSVTTIRRDGFSYVPPMPGFREVTEQLALGIPNVGAVLGPAIGLGAARVTACHFSVMAGDVGSLFNAGPHVVAKATFEEGLTAGELGGPDVH